MHKAFEYEAEFDKGGRRLKVRWSIGPVMITTAAGIYLALTGHTIWNKLADMIALIRSW